METTEFFSGWPGSGGTNQLRESYDQTPTRIHAGACTGWHVQNGLGRKASEEEAQFAADAKPIQ